MTCDTHIYTLRSSAQLHTVELIFFSLVIIPNSLEKCSNSSIHPFSSTQTIQGCGGDGAFPSSHRARGGVHPGQFTSLL